MRQVEPGQKETATKRLACVCDKDGSKDTWQTWCRDFFFRQVGVRDFVCSICSCCTPRYGGSFSDCLD